MAGIPGLLMALLIWKFVREPEHVSGGSAPHKMNLGSLLAVLKYRNVWLSCLAAVGFLTWLFLQNIFAPLYIAKVGHQDAATAGLLLGASGLGSFFIGLLLPRFSDRIGRKPILFLMAALSAASPLVLLTSPLYSHMPVMAALLFLTNGGQAIAALALVLIPAETVPAAVTATGIGVTNLVGEIVWGHCRACRWRSLGGTLRPGSHDVDVHRGHGRRNARSVVHEGNQVESGTARRSLIRKPGKKSQVGTKKNLSSVRRNDGTKIRALCRKGGWELVAVAH